MVFRLGKNIIAVTIVLDEEFDRFGFCQDGDTPLQRAHDYSYSLKFAYHVMALDVLSYTISPE